MHKRFRTFTDRYPYLGPIIWLLNVQYFVVQVMVAVAWPVPYNWLRDAISDLGNTACGVYSDHYVCSPMHSIMNASFISLGMAMLIGSVLISQEFRGRRGRGLGFDGMAIAGVGTLLVGLFPENTIGLLHTTGALLAFLIGNLAIVAFGLYLDLPKSFRRYTLTSGIVSLTALTLLLTNHRLGLGFGGMERLTGYPQTVWLIAFGAYMSRNHYLARHGRQPRSLRKRTL